MRSEFDEKHARKIQTVLGAVTATDFAAIITNLSFEQRNGTDDISLYLLVVAVPLLIAAWLLLDEKKFPSAALANYYYNSLLTLAYLASGSGVVFLIAHPPGHFMAAFLLAIPVAMGLFAFAHFRAQNFVEAAASTEAMSSAPEQRPTERDS